MKNTDRMWMDGMRPESGITERVVLLRSCGQTDQKGLEISHHLAAGEGG